VYQFLVAVYQLPLIQEGPDETGKMKEMVAEF
jgi:hypothetical protein